ncbi:MAG: DUF1802 family protein [Spirirestis rafaelensis WJT71-NPBG6]|jgi:hypothetical protein|nr:DUF1802 family protein [Spirirestis rafaelensis WJT71-NPBG6]
MSESVLIYNALCLPAPDVKALIQGRMIAAIPRKLINNPGQPFALYPGDVLIKSLALEHHYRSNYLPIAQQVINNLDSDKVIIKAWAKCELRPISSELESLKPLSQLTIWTTEALQETLRQRPYTSLAYLRVYLLSQPIEMPVYTQRHFVALPQQLMVSDAKPVLSDRIFNIRKHQLQNLQPPLHPQLEELQSALVSLATTNSAAKQLEQDINVFLGWTSEQFLNQTDSDLAWINDIAKLGDRSIELEEKKSNYQAGTDFEIIVRRSLEFLGFKIEEAYKGGAGGLDLFCSQPYPLVCECKAGKLIPSRTVEELLKLGGMHLGKSQLLSSAKLIIGPGKPSSDTLKASKEWEVSIINAMTLQKLVELKVKYPGSINLVELKQYLETGQIDNKIDEYINQVEKQIALRSQLIELVKNYLEKTGFERASVDSLHGAFSAISSSKLHPQEMHEILIELSSPLTGYLGRIKGKDWRSDRFYFLRDLPTN